MRYILCIRSSVTSRRSRKSTLTVEDEESVGDAVSEEEDEDEVHEAAVVEEEEVEDPRFVPGSRIKWEWISEIEDI